MRGIVPACALTVRFTATVRGSSDVPGAVTVSWPVYVPGARPVISAQIFSSKGVVPLAAETCSQFPPVAATVKASGRPPPIDVIPSEVEGLELRATASSESAEGLALSAGGAGVMGLGINQKLSRPSDSGPPDCWALISIRSTLESAWAKAVAPETRCQRESFSGAT